MKNIVIICNIVTDTCNTDTDLISDVLSFIKNALQSIRMQNIFLLMEDKERKIYNIYEKDMNIISNSLLSIIKNVSII